MSTVRVFLVTGQTAYVAYIPLPLNFGIGRA